MSLAEIIQTKIKSQGPISFHDFMEMSLYYPDMGYYTSSKEKIGTEGDFYTSSSVSAAFGAMLGRQLVEMWQILGKNDFTILEYGAGTGWLCHDILDYIKFAHPEFYDKLSYCIIEKSPVMRAKEKTHLCEKVSWHDSYTDIQGLNGCIISNELVDNFAVHQVVMQKELMEVFVDHRGCFTEQLQPATAELREYLKELQVDLPVGFRTEINIEATEWIQNIAKALKQGFIITIDYGFPSFELYQDHRRSGTLLCYNKHGVNDNPYINIGEQDITSHVNFSALYYWGLKHGLERCGFTDQGHFLLSLGFEDYIKQALTTEKNESLKFRKLEFLTYTMLYDMGQKFKVLIQQKGIPKQKLSGFMK